ncbi:MAG: RNA-directed DNA polymerase, partial [Clostridium sp.]
FGEINFLVTKTLKARLKNYLTDKPSKSETYKRLYGKYNGKIRTIQKITIFPIYGCRTKPPMCFSQNINNYTIEGRQLIHKKLGNFKYLIEHLLRSSHDSQSIEYNDNRISLIAGQQGKCYVTGNQLEIGNMECHHKKAKFLGGTDDYKNLMWISEKVHKLIHSTKQETIEKYLKVLQLDDKGLKRVNSLRKQVENLAI